MKLIESTQQEQIVAKTNTKFWERNILAKTDKAFYIRTFNNRGAIDNFWIPISKIQYIEVEIPQGKVKKYYAPKFFTK